MLKIKTVKARQIIDSRGNPTVEADLVLSDGSLGRAAVPSGASTGAREAVEKRDGVEAYAGKGVLGAVNSVNNNLQSLCDMVADQAKVDETMLQIDATPNKEKLGANAILAVSMALSQAVAISRKQPLFMHFNKLFGEPQITLPVPMINILNGGAHADNSVDFQEFMIIPANFDTFTDAIRCGTEIFHALKKVLSDKGYQTTVGDEGGFAPNLGSNQEALELVMQAIELAHYRPFEQVFLGLDIASSEFYNDGLYHLQSESKSYDSQGFAELLANWRKKFPIISIEDGMDEDDWHGWKILTDLLGSTTQLVGDDLFVTNVKSIQEGIDQQVANSVLVKVNQIGTINETLSAMKLASSAGYSCVVSHRSGETEDTTIADLAVGSGCGQIKTGSMSRSDRVAKYNQLLRIEETLGDSALYLGSKVFSKFL